MANPKKEHVVGGPKSESIIKGQIIKADSTPEENESAYSKLVLLPGFRPWEHWVPMPYPHRELTYSRGMYMRGENLTV